MNRIYAAGSRRSAQPVYTPLLPTLSTPNEDLLQLLTGQVAQGGAQVTSPQQALTRGSSVLSGQGNNLTSTTGGNAVSPKTLAALGLGASSLGVLAQQPELGAVGGMLNLSGNLAAAKNNSEALSAFAPMAGSLLGLPVAPISFAKAAYEGDNVKMIDSLTALHPVLGALNALAAVLGIGTLGSAIAGQPKLGDYSLATTRPVQSSGSSGGGNYSLSSGNSNGGLGLQTGGGLGLNPSSGGLGLSAGSTRSSSGGGWQNGGYGGDNGGPAW